MIEILNKTTGEIETFTQEQFEAKRNKMLVQWEQVKKQLESAKEQEMQLRKQIVDFAFDQNKNSGTERVELGNGYELKAVKKVSYGFIKGNDNKINKSAIEKALQKIEKDGAAGELIAERLVQWNPTLSLTEYKLLSDKHLKAINEVIVTTEGAPTLEIIEPKAK